MKNYSIYLLVLLIGISSCQSEGEGIKISGKVDNKVAGETIVIYRLETDGIKPLDTIKVADNGTFETYLKPSEPSFYQLNFFKRQKANLILDGTETEVVIKLDGNSPNGEVIVEGSPHTTYLKQLDGLVGDYKQDVQELNQEAIQARMNDNQERLKELTDNYYRLVNESQANIKTFIWNITPSIAAIYGLQSLNMEENVSFFDSVATRFNEQLPDHVLTKDLVKQIEDIRKLAIGSPAPEISLPTPDGEVLTLSSLRGNYVLIDFWAAWCKPCRQENPNVVKVYKEYADENFEILGVSLDRTREAWVNAIQQDGLPWKHVSDLQYFNSEAAADYRIEAIPATYLIDPEGNIIAKGLRGGSLEAKLKEIFG